MKRKNKEKNFGKNSRLPFIEILLGVILTILAFLIDNAVINNIFLIQTNFFLSIASAITFIGETWFFLLICAAISLMILKYKKPLMSFWVSVAISAGIGFLLKLIIRRPRPFEVLNVESVVSTSFSSFPSGHAIAVFSILPYISKYFPKYRWIAWSIALLVAFTRIYLNVHYISDVIAGAFIGYIIGKIVVNWND